MRTVAILALFGLAAASKPAYNEYSMMKLYEATAAQEDDSESSSDDEQDVYLNGVYQPWQSGQQVDGYERVLPTRFSNGSDDLFMRSVIANYAQEGQDCDDDGKCKPTGSFTLDKATAQRVAGEVLATHKGLSGDALKSYLATYFNKAWGHFDVNRTGAIEAIKAPQLMRFLASDQRMSLGEF
jgi:hypothetical protein